MDGPKKPGRSGARQAASDPPVHHNRPGDHSNRQQRRERENWLTDWSKPLSRDSRNMGEDDQAENSSVGRCVRSHWEFLETPGLAVSPSSNLQVE